MYNSSMLNRVASEIDYLVIGHITRDLLPGGGSAWGGTASYASLTAQHLGRRAAVLTVFSPTDDLGALSGLPIAGAVSDQSTTFENIELETGRQQRVHFQAGRIHPHMLPETWRSAPIVHFGPVLDEIDPDLLRLFPDSYRILTPQGWMREVGTDGRVRRTDWIEAEYCLNQVDAVVISLEDVSGDERLVSAYAAASRLLVVTDGGNGSRIFKDGDEILVPGSRVPVLDSTGAGDIYAAAFGVYASRTGNPEAAAHFAGRLAAISVQRRNLNGVPTQAECMEATLAFETAASF